MLLMLFQRIKDAEEKQTRSSHQAREHGNTTQSLAPGGIVGEAVEARRVADVVDGVDGADEADGRERAADDKDGLKLLGGNVANEWDVRVDLAGVLRLTKGEPADE